MPQTTRSPGVCLAAAVLATALVAVTACAPADDATAREEKAARDAIAASAQTATQAAAIPSTGLWTEAHLVERLVRAGVAPRRVADALAGPEWMRATRLTFLAGGGELYVWIYADSSARRAVTDGLESLTGAPRGVSGPYAPPFLLIVQNNLAAIILGGRETNQERIALALQAGLPATTPNTAIP